MVYPANAVISLYRSTEVNLYGDKVQELGTPLYQGLEACLIERTETVLDPATQTPMTVRGSVLYLPGWVAPQVADQIIDQATGDKYAVEEVILPPTITGAPVNPKCSLRRVTGQGT